MGWYSDHQCAVDPAGGIQPEYFRKLKRVSFLFDFVLDVFRNSRIVYFLLYKCGYRADDRDYCVGDFLRDLLLRKKPVGVCVDKKILGFRLWKRQSSILPLRLTIARQGKIACLAFIYFYEYPKNFSPHGTACHTHRKAFENIFSLYSCKDRIDMCMWYAIEVQGLLRCAEKYLWWLIFTM